jgi:peroxiredoxin
MRHLTTPIATVLLAAAAFFSTAPDARAEAADFPPGMFSNGGQYKVSDFAGKVLVLFFYEDDCPRCRGSIPERNAVVAQFKDKPVKFLAVASSDTLNEAIGYTRETRLAMPAFADTLGVMQARYGFKISLQNIWQFRVIGPDGNISAMSMDPAAIEAAVAKVQWKYKTGGYDAKLNGVIELLEWNQHEAALRQLRPLAKAKSAAGESAAKLYEAVKAEGQQWLDEAAKAQQAEDVVKAHDLYAKVAACFAAEDLGKTATEALKALKENKAVKDELAARKMYDALANAMSRAMPKQRAEIVGFCNSIAKKYPETPTGKKAGELAKEIEAAGA